MVTPNFKKVYVQRAALEDLQWSANVRAILARFPKAEVKEVDSHWRIPELFEADPSKWIRTKNESLVVGIKSGLTHRVNGRSADFIAASTSNGCLSACQYCYVARRKGRSNPLTVFVNVDEIANSIEAHQAKLGPKLSPNQTDASLWTYDIGCNADLSLDALVCDNPRYLVERFAEMPHAKATFATKTVNDDYWLAIDPKGHTRIRYSIMPQSISRFIDVRTSPISERIRSVNRLVDAGYEVHMNFSPIVPYDGEKWKADWAATFEEVNDVLDSRVKAQLKCEAFMLSHSKDAHETNVKWNPEGEEYLWNPEVQVSKPTSPEVLVYDSAFRRSSLRWFEAELARRMPYCPVRYSF